MSRLVQPKLAQTGLMQVKLTVLDVDDMPRDVLISASQAAGVHEVAALLAESTAENAGPLFSDGRLLGDKALLGGPGLRTGCVLTRSISTSGPEGVGSALLLKIIAGPDCGHIVPLQRGSHVIGRGEEADITLNDPELSRRHLRLLVGMHTVEAEDLGSTNGTTIDGHRLTGSGGRVPSAGFISIGNTRLQVAAVTEPPAIAVPDDAGCLVIHRPPIAQQWPESVIHRLPDSPAAAPRPRIQWWAAAIPTVISAVLALSLHSVQLLAFVALSPVTVLTSGLADRRSWRRSIRKQNADRAQARRLLTTDVERSLRAEEAFRHRTFADTASILLSATARDCRLWERRPGRRSFLTIRIGLADQPADIMINNKGAMSSAGVVPMVPATIDLTTCSLGIAGPRRDLDGFARSVVGQLMVLHSPTDLELVLLTDQSRSAGWRWLRWVPAVASTIAISAQQRQRIDEDLQRILHERRLQQPYGDRPWTGRWVLVVLDLATPLTGLPGMSELIEHGTSVGITVLCVVEDFRSLPAGCSATIRFTEVSGAEALCRRPGQPDLSVRIDHVDAAWADRLARSLGSLRDAEDQRRADEANRQVRLIDLLGPADIDAAAIRSRWRSRARGGPPIAPLGVSRAGAFAIDLVRDGPHLLIAGTTGSGKSELLRSLVAGLAVQHPPDELSFVLIDYKGGAAFAECADLPHVTGLVTDLDPHLTRRVLVSLNAELHRRECVFAEAGVSDFGDYQRGSWLVEQQLTRLILVIDEFASLAEELPEFLNGLLGIAQRGRSLGVHLVLATQRPAGVLSADIKANMGLRISLRVTDAAESVDVIGVSQASRISRTTPGRAIARQADGQLLEFQTARATQPVVPPDPLTLTALDEWNQPIEVPSDPDCTTELAALRQAVIVAAEGLRRPEPPWLPPLPAVLTVAPCTGSSRVVFGHSDEPALQRQSPVALELTEGSSIAFIGGPRSGRTSALRTVIGTAVSQLTADQLHVYVIDCAGVALQQLGQLPHCGAVLDATEPAAVGRLITRLAVERKLRQQELAELGVAAYPEGHRAGSTLPAIIVALDGWENFSALSNEMDGGKTADAFIQLLREGPTAGFTLLVTGDRGALGARLGSAVGRKLLLPLTDQGDYAVAGLDRAAIPTEQAPGRAVTADKGVEIQLAMLTEDVSTGAQWDWLQARAMAQSPIDRPPTIRMRPLPPAVGAADLFDRARRQVDGLDCWLGLGGDNPSVSLYPLFRPRARFLIAGPDGSGKSTAAMLIARQSLSRGLRIAVAATIESPLADWAYDNDLPVIGPESSPADITSDLLLVEDAEQFTDTLAGEQLQAWIAATATAVVVTARTSDLLMSFRGIGVEMRRHRCGILLQPSAVDGELLGIRLPQLPASSIPGRGVLVTAETRSGIGGYQPIQVAA
jgi:DNA segregation ATPase FtsK/SpoIIIE, S-DNA-T family